MRRQSALGTGCTCTVKSLTRSKAVMSEVTRKLRRSEMTEMSVIVSISSCLLRWKLRRGNFTNWWWRGCQSSDFDPRCVCRNLIKSDWDWQTSWMSSDCIILLSSTGSAVVQSVFCCTTNTAQVLKVWKIGFVSKFSLRTWEGGRGGESPFSIGIVRLLNFWRKFLWILPAGRMWQKLKSAREKLASCLNASKPGRTTTTTSTIPAV